MSYSEPQTPIAAGCAFPRLMATTMLTRERLEPYQKLTLEIGSAVVLGTLAVGLQFGHWSPWAALAAFGGYLVWVIAYSEATVRAAG
jgi:hypothetical protein